LLLLAALIWAIWDWQETLLYLAVGIGIAVLIPSTFFLPLYVWFLFREKSFAGALSQTWRKWKEIFVSILNHV